MYNVQFSRMCLGVYTCICTFVRVYSLRFVCFSRILRLNTANKKPFLTGQHPYKSNLLLHVHVHRISQNTHNSRITLIRFHNHALVKDPSRPSKKCRAWNCNILGPSQCVRAHLLPANQPISLLSLADLWWHLPHPVLSICFP